MKAALATALIGALMLPGRQVSAQVASSSSRPQSTDIQRLRASNDSLSRLVDSLRRELARGAAARSAAGEATTSATDTVGTPFGLRMGMSERAIRAIARLDSVAGQRGQWRTARLPSGLPNFEFYSFLVSPKQGLCKVTAVGRDVRTSAYGAEARAEYERIEELVTEKYGATKRLDYLKAGSIWDEPRDWMMGLVKQERVLASYWVRSDGAALPPSLGVIALELNALDSETAYLRLAFQFTNFEACAAELKSNPF